MKNLLFLLICTTGLTLMLQAQRTNLNQFEKGTKTITVIIPDSEKHQAFEYVLNILIDDGFEITGKDKELGTITTNWKPLPQSGSYKLNIRVGDQVTFRGQFLSGVSFNISGVISEDLPEDIQKRGQSKSIYGISFNEMVRVAEKAGEVKM
jgi:hypothetical protein